ncbi:MAG: GyrI-like domain-containing protein [Bacteroidota bacterium]|nr:GyrI-like domain-containing protein [Bacteroidota bacterium]
MITSITSPILLDEPTIVHFEEQRTAVIRFTIRREEIRSVMGPAYGDLHQVLQEQSIEAVGPFFTHHFRMDPEVFDFELGVPVNASIKPQGRVLQGKLPAAKVMRTVYRGGYEGMGAAWQKFDQLIRELGHQAVESLWESYVKGPESGSDQSKWETEFNRPLK